MNEIEASVASSSPELSQQRHRASGEGSISSTAQIQSLTTGPAAARLLVTGAAADTELVWAGLQWEHHGPHSSPIPPVPFTAP